MIEMMPGSIERTTVSRTVIPLEDTESGSGIGQHSQMAAAPGSHGRCRAPILHRSSTAIALATGGRAVTPSISTAGLADRLGQRSEIVLVGRRRGESAFVPNEFPAFRGGGGRRVDLAQIPGMWFVDRRERPDDSGGVGIDIRERRNGRTVAPRPAASTQRSHTRDTRPPLGHPAARHTANSPR